MSTRSTAIVTGGSRGFGFELARALAADGWAVVIDGRSSPAVARSMWITIGPRAKRTS